MNKNLKDFFQTQITEHELVIKKLKIDTQESFLNIVDICFKAIKKRRKIMSHMNIVKFHVDPDHIDGFLEAFRNATLNQGQISGKLVQIAENKFCSIGLWESQSAMDEAMDDMISFLDTIRHMLITISEDLGLTDPASGPILIEHN